MHVHDFKYIKCELSPAVNWLVLSYVGTQGQKNDLSGTVARLGRTFGPPSAISS
jgi:hypothetical protein